MGLDQNKRFEFLDSLRGLAAVSVLCSHFVLAYGFPTKSPTIVNALTNSPLHIWWDGFAAVSLFFVLSGFVLSLRLFEDSSRFNRKDQIQYQLNRIFRIWPPYACCFLVSILLSRFNFYSVASNPLASSWVSEFWLEPLTASQLLREFALILTVPTYFIVPQAWTLSIELLLSCFVPVAAMFAKYSSLLFLIILAALVFLLKIPMYAIHFSLGILIAKHLKELQRDLGKLNAIANAALIFVGLFLYTFRFTLPVYIPNLINENRIFYITGLGSALLILALMRMPSLQKLLTNQSLHFVGKISYGIYLTHFFILLWFLPKFLLMINRAGFGNENLAWYFSILACLTLTLVVSLFFHKIIEVPSIRLGKSIGKKLLGDGK